MGNLVEINMVNDLTKISTKEYKYIKTPISQLTISIKGASFSA